MSIGTVSISTSQKRETGGPFAVGSAHNGTSIDAGGLIVLGNDVGAIGNPARLLNTREIFGNGNSIILRDSAAEFTDINGGRVITAEVQGTTTMQGNGVRTALAAGQQGDVAVGLGVDILALHVSALGEKIIRGNGTDFIDYMAPTNSTRIGQIVNGFPDNGSAVQAVGTFTHDKYLVVPSTGAVALDENLDGSKIFTNELGASTFSLPVSLGLSGLSFKFYVQQGANLTVLTGGTDTINLGGLVSSAGGNIRSNLTGSFVELTVMTDGEWAANSFTGNWIVA